MSVLVGIVTLLFWAVAYPHALSYHEQYQLFEWTGDYFLERVSLPGGLADWAGEFLVQFFYYPWLGASLLALLFVLLQGATARLMPERWYLLSLATPIIILWVMGDINTMWALPVALAMVLAVACVKWPQHLWWIDLLATPVLWWLAGPVVWLYVIIRVIQYGWRLLSAMVVLAVAQAASCALLPQWPVQQVLTGIPYYRIPLHYPQLSGYDIDTYELIWQDYQIRGEHWDAIIKRAREYTVKTAFWSNSVNLALSQKRQLAELMFDFYQSDDEALLMASVRDQTSNLPSAEAMFRLGLVNSAQRYMFDIQQSILNGKKSGRCITRIIQCMLVNGHYKTAEKYVDLLEKSLFYSNWAKEVRQVITSDSTTRERLINTHPVLGRLRQLRFKNDFLFSYSEKDKIFGLLFMDNHDNKMALDYFIGELLLRGDVQGVMQYMPLAEQYGSYRYMPVGYQDAVQCIRKRGNLPGSKYGAYVKRMMQR